MAAVVSNIVKVLFESKPQHYHIPSQRPLLCQISLKSFLKANHNVLLKRYIARIVVSNIVKVLFESKPQLGAVWDFRAKSCVKYR